MFTHGGKQVLWQQDLWQQEPGGTREEGQALPLSVPAYPTCPSVMSGLERPKRTPNSASSLTDGKPRALEQKGLDKLKLCGGPRSPSGW